MDDQQMMEQPLEKKFVMVACPDARPPAYQAVIGLSQAGVLGRFVTSAYYNPESPLVGLARRLTRRQSTSWDAYFLRRYHPSIPFHCVSSVPSIDLYLRLEALAARRSRAISLKRACAKARTIWFDYRLARLVSRYRPSALLAFSDVASGITIPLCRRLGIPIVLSMVHGEVQEEIEVLKHEAEVSPDFFPIYQGDGVLDRNELSWLHERRLRDIALADLILVPSEHIADRLRRSGMAANKIRIIPYAADSARFHPLEQKPSTMGCTFLFAGGITQRKGIKYLLAAWAQIRRPDWKLQLLGALPSNLTPLASALPYVQLLGRVAHQDVPPHMASADVFVFPSLFEGSAVVTYEALASGLPSIVTTASGSVVRDHIDGFLVPPGDVQSLAHRMGQLGNSPLLRAAMAKSARARSLDFSWSRYHSSVVHEVLSVMSTSYKRAKPYLKNRSLCGLEAQYE